MERELLRLLKDYYHYKYMTQGIMIIFTQEAGMSIYDFMKWLESRDK